MPLTDTGWLITPDELKSWILHEDEEVVVINKPGLVLCHPSKSGAWSSLVGACREYFGSDRLHMPSRLDRETSGVVVFARTQELGSLLQRAIQHRHRLLQIDDVNPIALRENKRLHTRIPLVGAVTEMDAALQEGFHRNNCHFFS